MAAARKTTNTARSTSDAKATETKTETAKTEASPVVENDQTAQVKAAAEEAAREALDETGGVVDPADLQAEAVPNPDLATDRDKVAEGVEEQKRFSEVHEKEAEKREEQRRSLLEDGKPTAESYDDPHVNLADLPVNFDPVVADDHAQASRAAEIDNQKLVNAAPVQVTQMDSSVFGQDVRDVLSFTLQPVHKDDAKDDDKK